MMAEDVRHEPGIYFGLDEDAYHADDALGSTSIKALALDATEFQHTRLHGKERDEVWLTYGSALHARVLEGPAAFAEKFLVAPSKDNYPNCLVTVDDLKTFAGQLGLKGGKVKADWIALIRDHGVAIEIWDEIVADFEKKLEGKAKITKEMKEGIERAAEWMQADPYLQPVMRDGVFVAGASEVSIFYEEDGVRLKCRIDHLLPHAVLDLKTFRVSRMERISVAGKRAIARERYDLQAADYMRGLAVSESLFKDGKVFGAGEAEMALLKRVYENIDGFMKRKMRDDGMEFFHWIWVLVKNSGAPQPLVDELDMRSMIFGSASEEVNRAIDVFKKLTAEFGADKDWPPRHPVEVLDDVAFPSWAFM